MAQSQINWRNALKPNFKVLALKQRLWCGFGALLGLGLSSLISWWILGDINAWYIAPMGASSVLLFAVPASPLSQPWNIVVGNSIAAIIGVSCAYMIPNLTVAFSVAVALAVVVMMSTDSLHPPSGAVAITAVIGGDAVHQLGYQFVLYPVLLNSLLLLGVAVIFNRMLGKQYPQLPQLNTRSTDPTPTQKATIHPQDIRDVLAQQTQLLDISEYDLQKLILAAQGKATARAVNPLRCEEVMSKEVVSLNEDDDITVALDQFKRMNLMSLPVIDVAQKIVGTLALYQVVEWFKRTVDMPTHRQHQVKHIMLRQVVTVKPQQHIQDLVPYFVERSFNYIPVVQHEKLLGIISRADMIAALNQQLNQQHSA